MGDQEMQWGRLVFLSNNDLIDQINQRFAGQIMPRGAAAIATDVLISLGTWRGLAASDVASARGEQAFHLDDHLERLRHSVKELRIKCPAALHPDKSNLLKKDIARLLERNGFGPSLIWLRVDGPSQDGFNPTGESYLLAMTSEFDESLFCNPKGIAVRMVPYKRQMPRIKFTGDYALAVTLRNESESQGYDEILYTGSGEKIYGLALELSQKNLFVVMNGVLITPKDGVLHGITRKIVISLAKKNGIEVREESIPMTAIWDMEEIFATSTTSGVVHIRKMDDKELALGPITKELQAAFLEYRENYF